ncbi:MAG: secretin N-terminal domain-containing protein [Novosphingobium sp.]
MLNAAALLLTPGLAALPLSAFAQSNVPSVIEDMKLVSEDEGQAAFMLRFSPQDPQLVPLNTNPGRPAVIIRNALRVNRIPVRQQRKGLVRQAEFETSGADLVLRFDVASPARVTVEPAGEKTWQIKVRKVSEEEATGSRPLGSDKDQVVKASDLVQDSVRAGDSYELIPLKYADVSEVIGLLTDGTTVEPNNVFIRREPGFGSPGSGSQPQYLQTQGQPQRNDRPLGQSFGNGLAIDRRLNAIWISGTPERIARVKEQIALIDQPVDSVILETQFVELTESGAKNLGIDFTNSAGQIAVGRIETGAFLPNSISLGPRDILPSGVLQAAIYAQIEKGEGRILSRPRIAAQSGSTAKIITGDALPILTAITLSGVNGVSQQVQYVNVGVTLQIAPRVSSDGFVTSQIYGVVSSVTGYSQGYPTISQREAETSASVRDGETFVIGGLTQENVLKRKGKVPLLGDIPLVGQAFRTERSSSSKTELYIVITPHIVRHRRFEATEPANATAPAATELKPVQ